MSPEERQLLAGLFERIKGAASAPRDQEAEAFINEAVKAQPAAPYLLAQSVIVQDQALQAANQKLQELEARVRELQAQAQQKPAGGFLSGLFGGGAASAPPPRPAPQPGYGQPQGGPWGAPPQQQGGYAPAGYPPQQQGGFAPQPQGGGFLQGALGAAAGVAGGVLLADGIRSLFHGGAGGGLGIGSGFNHAGFDPGGETTIVNNYYGDGGPAGGQNAGYDAGGYDTPAPTDASYDSSDYDSGGYDDGGDGGFDA